VTDEEALQVERDALERYWRAVELADGVREAWTEEGQPLTMAWPNGVVSEAPLLKLLREAERDCERFARAIPTPARKPGRKPVATMEASIGQSPAAKLRAVK
jgi:hypothetical protein